MAHTPNSHEQRDTPHARVPYSLCVFGVRQHTSLTCERAHARGNADIDLDQEAIDDAVGTPDFERAKKIYEMGAHSKPTATCKLVTPANLLTDTKKGDAVKFTSVGSDNVQGKAYKNYDANTTSTFLFTYPVSSDQVQPEESRCYEGGLAVNKWSSQGCIANSNTGLSTFNLNGHDYTANCTNSGKRTLQGFSTKAYDVMWACSPMVDPNATYRVGCPYTSYAPVRTASPPWESSHISARTLTE